MGLFKILLKETFLLRAFGWTKVPLLYWCLPSVIRLDETGCTIRIPLTRRTRNHLNSMYFGALCVGADCAGGLMAYRLIQKSGVPVSLVFKDFQASFLKRPEGDVDFRCEQGHEIREFVERVIASGEREDLTVTVLAFVPSSTTPDEAVARFTLTLSLKRR